MLRKVFSRIKPWTLSWLRATSWIASAPPRDWPYTKIWVLRVDSLDSKYVRAVCASMIKPFSDGRPVEKPYPRYERMKMLQPICSEKTRAIGSRWPCTIICVSVQPCEGGVMPWGGEVRGEG